ncbi:MAG: hypothetical protein N3D73_03220, partial [Candidatus Diapherotrites archaeon]|nr:hypothetical protein [Candidatus Diapherotrites archaeon]
YNNLLSKTKQHQVYIMLYKPYHNEYQILDVSKINKIETKVKAQEFGNKIGTRVYISKNNFISFNKDNFRLIT